MFAATLDLADDDVDFLGVAGEIVQVLDVSDRGGLERKLLKGSRVMGVHMAGMDTEGAILGQDLGHLFLRQQQRTANQKVSPSPGGSSGAAVRCQYFKG
jgi:hypothetical protein